jgi:hypothetical protein
MNRSDTDFDPKVAEQQGGLELYAKIVNVMKVVPSIQKDGLVDYTSKKTGAKTKYDYIKAETVIGKVRSAMAKEGLIMYPIRTTMIDKQGSTVCLIVTYRIADSESKQFIEVQSIGAGMDSGDKHVYKAMTGAIKYALLQAFMIAVGWNDPDDISSDEYKDRTESQSEMSPKVAQSYLFNYGQYKDSPKNVYWVYNHDMETFNAAIDDPNCSTDLQTACIVFADAMNEKKKGK